MVRPERLRGYKRAVERNFIYRFVDVPGLGECTPLVNVPGLGEWGLS